MHDKYDAQIRYSIGGGPQFRFQEEKKGGLKLKAWNLKPNFRPRKRGRIIALDPFLLDWLTRVGIVPFSADPINKV